MHGALLIVAERYPARIAGEDDRTNERHTVSSSLDHNHLASEPQVRRPILQRRSLSCRRKCLLTLKVILVSIVVVAARGMCANEH